MIFVPHRLFCFLCHIQYNHFYYFTESESESTFPKTLGIKMPKKNNNRSSIVGTRKPVPKRNNNLSITDGTIKPVPKRIETIKLNVGGETIESRRKYKSMIGCLRDNMNIERGPKIFENAHYVDIDITLNLDRGDEEEEEEEIVTPKIQKTDVYLFAFKSKGVVWEFGDDPKSHMFKDSKCLIYPGSYQELLVGVDELAIGFDALRRAALNLYYGKNPDDFRTALGTLAWTFSEASRFQPIFRKMNTAFVFNKQTIMDSWSFDMARNWRVMRDKEEKIGVVRAAAARRSMTITNQELEDRLFLTSGEHAAICLKVKHVKSRIDLDG